MNQLDYKVDIKQITKNNIKDFSFLENKRKLRSNKVTQLKRLILAGEHFDAPIVVNKNGKFRTIDGFHRMTAISKALDVDDELVIEVLLIVYNGLTKQEEIGVFRRWNIGTKQSSDDFVKMHESELHILKLLRKDFPVEVGIYKSSLTMHFKLLIGGYIAAKNRKVGGYTNANEVFIEDVKTLEIEDYEFLKRFVKGFIKLVGSRFDKSNIFMNTTPFYAIIYLYYNTKHRIDEIDFWDLFLTKVMSNQQIVELSLHGGVSATKTITHLMDEAMRLKLLKYEPNTPII